MEEQAIWRVEARLWREGAAAFDELLAEDCVMAFAPPVGILRGRSIPESLAGAPRWDDVDMADRVVARPDGDTLVLAYRAIGRRGGEPPYGAICTSTWRRHGAAWRLVQHQQTSTD